MAAAQETEDLAKAPATSAAVICTMKRPVGRNGRLIKKSSDFSPDPRGVLCGHPEPFLGVSGASA